jgi:hypothetical protein
MILDTGTLDAATLKALCDLLCRAYGSSGDNKYRLNVAGVAMALSDRITAAERAQDKPKLAAVEGADA